MSISSVIKAGLVALTLGASVLATVPAAQAAPFSFSFGFGLPGGPDMFMHPHSGIILHFGDPGYYDYCLNDHQVRRLLEHHGYDDVQIVKYYNDRNWVVVVAEQDGDWYQMVVDRCTGEVDHIRPVHHSDNGNFGLSLNF